MSTPYIAVATAQPVRESPLNHQHNDHRSSHKRVRVGTPPNDNETGPTIVHQPTGHQPTGRAIAANGSGSMVQAGTQTEGGNAAAVNGNASSATGTATTSRGGTGRDRASTSLSDIRQSISEQFDIEILLKHRELRVIEDEMAKTQVCIEQLRRCTLLPFPGPETQLNHVPSSSNDYYPPPPGVLDGPYTRHYSQWLLRDQKFDGPMAESSSRGRASGNDQFTSSGRPQRQSTMKTQPRPAGEQGCLYRRRDGVLVRLVCDTCKRSNFNSAQGFINHCRIAHQREYASHDIAADVCGEPVDESAQSFVSPPAVPMDGPSRNTRHTYNPVQPSPQNSYYTHGRNSSAVTANTANVPIQTPRATHPPARKPGRHAAMTTPRNQPVDNFHGQRPPTPPHERGSFSTQHLEKLMKSKNFNIDVGEVMKSVTGPLDSTAASESEAVTEDERNSFLNARSSPALQTPESLNLTPSGLGTNDHLTQNSGLSFSSDQDYHITPTSRRAGLIGHRTVPSPLDMKKAEAAAQYGKESDGDGDGDVSMGDSYDASSSSDEEGGYDSDAGAGDDDLYDLPSPSSVSLSNNMMNDTITVQGGGSSSTATILQTPGYINPALLHLTGGPPM